MGDRLWRGLGLWIAITVVGAVASYRLGAIAALPRPDPALLDWAFATLDGVRKADTRPAPVPAAAEPQRGYRARGPVVVLAWQAGKVVARHEGPPELMGAVRGAVAAWQDEPPWPADRAVRFSLAIPEGEAPLLNLPLLKLLQVVPRIEGVRAEVAGMHAALTPDDVWALGVFDTAVDTPIPDLAFGTDLGALRDALAARMGVEPSRLQREGRLRRVRAQTYHEGEQQHRTAPPAPAVLSHAAQEGARFLLRHQARDGRFAYVYDARRGRVDNRGYNVVRHAGTAYFLAQAGHMLPLEDARAGALRAVQWLIRNRLRSCGDQSRLCVDSGRGPNVGATALTVLAITEWLVGEPDSEADHAVPLRKVLRGLLAFLQSMQRPDGELMHEYDLERDRPVDVQRLYYSGEAALALLRAHRVLGDASVLETAERLMGHVMGRHWQFFGSRYYYGEEHWTCMAVGEAADRLDVQEGLNFCRRWARFNDRLQYRHQSPWPIEGAYGLGPLLLPMTTPAATRAEAFISIYPHLAPGKERRRLAAQIDRALGFLTRSRFGPGPSHLLAHPRAARGGIPKSPGSFEVRNDFVQHACSAMLRWAQVRPN